MMDETLAEAAFRTGDSATLQAYRTCYHDIERGT
jgi:hypothetical protein